MVIKRVGNNAQELGFNIQGLTFSPLKGASGNIEYLIYLTKNITKEKIDDFSPLIKEIVEQAHQELSK